MQWLCWLLGTSVRKIDEFALDLLVFLGAVAFTDEAYRLMTWGTNSCTSGLPEKQDIAENKARKLRWKHSLKGLFSCTVPPILANR